MRVISPERDGASLGSGTLVDVSASHGLVLTNWHVVRDAAGNVIVSFPDGFQSPGFVLKTDRDWDLAAVAIWRPHVSPVPIAIAAAAAGRNADDRRLWGRQLSGDQRPLHRISCPLAKFSV